jgi:hypothetical protein
VSDAEELRIQRKQRQTEGLGLWGTMHDDAMRVLSAPSPMYDARPMVFENTEDGYEPRPSAPMVRPETSHPDSVAGQSQAGLILRHLQSGATLTALDALDLFGCNRLAARVADLKGKGYNVKSRWLTLANGKRVSEYYLTTEAA